MPSAVSILFVEDETPVRDVVIRLLSQKGFRVFAAADGYDAVRILAGHHIDLLFTDVVMPGALSGADLARAALERRPELRVLFTSGYTTRLVEKEWPDRRLELLRKPYRSIDLAARVRAVLNGASTAA